MPRWCFRVTRTRSFRLPPVQRITFLLLAVVTCGQESGGEFSHSWSDLCWNVTNSALRYSTYTGRWWFWLRRKCDTWCNWFLLCYVFISIIRVSLPFPLPFFFLSRDKLAWVYVFELWRSSPFSLQLVNFNENLENNHQYFDHATISGYWYSLGRQQSIETLSLGFGTDQKRKETLTEAKVDRYMISFTVITHFTNSLHVVRVYSIIIYDI